MIYLDYSATTPVDEQVIDTFVKVTRNYIGNPNSLHKLGTDAKKIIDASTEQIANLLGVKTSEIIYTSGASESNNLAIKGICMKYKNRGNHIITTDLEHSSVIAPLSYLQNNGFDVDIVNLNSDGKVDLEHLKSLLRDDTILVTIASVSSELGIIQPIEEISSLIKEYPKCFFHVDATQSIGKNKMSFDNIDLVSLSSQKYYGIKGVGILIKKEKILLEPLIHGGKSTTIFRSGTPATGLIASNAKALRLALENIDNKIAYVKELNIYLRNKLNDIDKVFINTKEDALPHILNISIPTVKPETMLHALEQHEIYISTQTACSANDSKSKAVFALTNDLELANSSLRISLSHLTTKEELDIFVDKLKIEIERLGR